MHRRPERSEDNSEGGRCDPSQRVGALPHPVKSSICNTRNNWMFRGYVLFIK